jgi:hypothetical protein
VEAESGGFVADGQERARAGIRAQVEAEYAELLKGASPASPENVARLRREMDRDLQKRLSSQAPRDGLY